jgi:two-component system nitrate/nitrite response regulator NarL
MSPRTRKPPFSSGHTRATTLGVVSRVVFYRQGLIRCLDQYPSVSATDLGSGGTESLRMAQQSSPEVVLVDLAMNAAAVFAEEVLDALPGTRLLAVIRTEREEDILRLADAGFDGFIPTDSTIDQLVREIRAAMRDELECSPRVAAVLLRNLRKRGCQDHRSVGTDLTKLTGRERQIAILLERNLSNKEIASELGIGFGTAKNHVHRILEKLGLHHRWDISMAAGDPQTLVLVPGRQRQAKSRRP